MVEGWLRNLYLDVSPSVVIASLVSMKMKAFLLKWCPPHFILVGGGA